MLELGYLGNGGTKISLIWWDYDIYDIEEL